MKRVVSRPGIVALAVLVSAVSLALPAGAAASKRPTPPRAVHATARTSTVKVTWHAPASKGGGAITGYTVTSRPGAKKCTTKALSCSVAGLTKGKSYAFVVTAKNKYGVSASSAASNHVTIALPSISIGDAGAQFVDQDNDANTALNTFLTAFGAATTQAELTTAVTNLQTSEATVVSTLTADRWPGSDATLVSVYSTELTTVVTDISNLVNAVESGTLPQLSSTTAIYYSDSNKFLIADEAVRLALELESVIAFPSTPTKTTVALGTVQTVSDIFGDNFSVSVNQVVDPATPAAGSGAADAGYRFVDVQLSVTDPPTTGEVVSDSNNDVTVIGSDGNTYTADFGSLNGCSNFTLGVYDVLPGDSTTGCVGFQVPVGVTVASVDVNLQPGLLNTAEWTN